MKKYKVFLSCILVAFALILCNNSIVNAEDSILNEIEESGDSGK